MRIHFAHAASTALLGALLLGGAAGTAAEASAGRPAETGGEVTWGVAPSTPDGPDGRTAFDYQVAPGTTISDWIAVTNYSEVTAEFRVYAADAATDYDTAQFTLIGAEQASTDLGAWTAVDSGLAECADTNDEAEEACARELGVRVTLAPGEARNIPFVITVPADATPGDHSAGVVASFAETPADQEGTLVMVEQRVGARVYLRVAGPLSAAVGVSGVTASYDGSWNPLGRGSATVSFDVTNTGNVRLSGAPSVELTGPFGISLGSVVVEPVANLLPGGTGHVTATLPRVPALFLLSASVTVVPEPGNGEIGGEPLALAAVSGSATTWAIPWAALGALAAVGALATFVVWRRRRSQRLLAAELAAYTEELLSGAGAGAAPGAASGAAAGQTGARGWLR
ncbi:MAG: hypothetical protein LBD97_09060 [Bifidobacteriaceae bacterium]|jgi:hypothetical protein|nr:hypothetical protein [Bifidobacteriaceae bacterium]